MLQRQWKSVEVNKNSAAFGDEGGSIHAGTKRKNFGGRWESYKGTDNAVGKYTAKSSIERFYKKNVFHWLDCSAMENCHWQV